MCFFACQLIWWARWLLSLLLIFTFLARKRAWIRFCWLKSVLESRANRSFENVYLFLIFCTNFVRYFLIIYFIWNHHIDGFFLLFPKSYLMSRCVFKLINFLMAKQIRARSRKNKNTRKSTGNLNKSSHVQHIPHNI